MMDYMDMEQGSDGQHYVLMLADKFSKIVEFVPAPAATAITACNAVLMWTSRYDIPTWIISDGDSHFRNHALKLLCDRMDIQHTVQTLNDTDPDKVVGPPLLHLPLPYTFQCLPSLDPWST